MKYCVVNLNVELIYKTKRENVASIELKQIVKEFDKGAQSLKISI